MVVGKMRPSREDCLSWHFDPNQFSLVTRLAPNGTVLPLRRVKLVVNGRASDAHRRGS